MRRHLYALLLILPLAACQSLGIANPVGTAQTVEQKAFALYGTYVIAEEEAADIVELAETPDVVKSVIRQTVVIAHPLAGSLRAAAESYGDVKDDLDALPNDAGLIAKATAALGNLEVIWQRAGPPMQALIGAVTQFKQEN